jgi:hypothetical protein
MIRRVHYVAGSWGTDNLAFFAHVVLPTVLRVNWEERLEFGEWPT